MIAGQGLLEGCAAPEAPAASDSKLIEFSAFDRQVCVMQSDESKQASLYSLVRSWVLNGGPAAAKRPEGTSTSVVLPPSQPLPKEPLQYPPECFSKFYLGENSSGELKNLANVYKSAWVTAHTHYSHHKLRRRRRHAQRHNTLLAVAQQTQKARNNGTTQPTPSVPSVHPQSAVPTASQSPPTKPASFAPTTSNSNAPTTSQQPLLDPSSRHGAAPGAQANTPQPLSSRSQVQGPPPHQHHPPSPGAFGQGFNVTDMSGVDSLRGAHNLAERSGPMRAPSPHGSMHEVPSTGSHGAHQLVPGPVNLADIHLRAAHQGHRQHPHQHQQQLAVSVAMDGPSVHAQSTSPNGVSGGAPTYNMHAMHAHHGGVSWEGRGVSWEGRHSEQETEDLQRQLQQLADKESPVPIAMQPPMPIDAGAQQALRGLSRRVTAGGNNRDPMHGAPGESRGKPPSGLSSGRNQPPTLPSVEQQHAVKVEQAQNARVGSMGGSNARQMGGVGHGRQVRGEGVSATQGGVGHGEMMMDCKPARTTSALLDMKDAFALDEVMDISPVA